ncbi:zf-HC2 domain-containing protein [Paenibacillus sp. RC67]|uniref:zf-HC2 domain-containing protein n=1 Tax=Paenibacillus sp. RC67 TaxID=3039392 RepID=UPI0024ADF604|nr:zf-HC2 domain-containing protein [Paenibacillus sp. RC67]
MCQEVIELMQRYLDQDLDKLEYEQMLGHLQHCSECTELFQRLVSLSQELEQLPKVTPAYSLVDAIMPKLQRIDEGFPAVEYPAAPVVTFPDKYKDAQIAEEAKAHVEHAAGWRKKMRGLVSMRIVGGVVAAGLVLGFFVFEQQDQKGSMKDAGSMLLSSTASQSKAENMAKQDTAPSASSKKAAEPTGAGGTSNQPADQKAAMDTYQPDSAAKAPAPAPAPAQRQESKAQASADGNKPVASTDMPQKKSADARTAEPSKEQVQQPSTDSSTVNDSNTSSSSSTEPKSKEAPVNEELAPPPVDSTAGGRGLSANKTGAPNSAQSFANPDSALSDSTGGSASSFAANQNETATGDQQNGDNVNKEKSGEMGLNQLYSVSSTGSPSTLTSQSKVYVASINDKRQVVITDNQQKVLFTSSHTWTEKDKIELVEWTESQLLTYRVTNESGTITYVINAKDKTELKK